MSIDGTSGANPTIRKGEFGIENNPVYLTEMPGGKECARDRVLTEAESKKDLDGIGYSDADWRRSRQSPPKISRTFRIESKLRLLTAQRGDEVQSMEWSEIDRASGWWTIPAEKTKNGLAHRVYLTPQSLRIIEEARKLCEKKPSKYVFPGPRGGYPSNVQKALQRIRTITGIQFRGHDRRRTAASMMTGDGIPRFTVGRILNHVEPGVTKIYDRYSYDKEKKEALEAWSKRLMLMASDLKVVKSEA